MLVRCSPHIFTENWFFINHLFKKSRNLEFVKVCNELVLLYKFSNLLPKSLLIYNFTGKSLSEALVLLSTNPQYGNRLFIELRVQYMKMLCTQIVFCSSSGIQNNFWTQHVLPMFCKKKCFWQRFICTFALLWQNCDLR